jgi:hypothetical protein
VVLDPRAIAGALTRKEPHELALPERALITFNEADLRRLTEDRGASVLDAWAPFRMIRLLSGTSTVVVRSSFGGPNIAALMEELSRSASESSPLGLLRRHGAGQGGGDVCLAEARFARRDLLALLVRRKRHGIVALGDDWTDTAAGAGFPVVDIWTTDALYRKTENKIEACIERAYRPWRWRWHHSMPSPTAKGLKAVAFLVVSDL